MVPRRLPLLVALLAHLVAADHFAKVENGIVTQVIVVEQSVLDTGAFGPPSSWVQTSYNTYGGQHRDQNGKPDGKPGLRKNYAAIGYHYDAVRDGFYAPQPFPSWTLNPTTFLWEAPTPRPDNIKYWFWDEATLSWKETKSDL